MGGGILVELYGEISVTLWMKCCRNVDRNVDLKSFIKSAVKCTSLFTKNSAVKFCHKVLPTIPPNFPLLISPQDLTDNSADIGPVSCISAIENLFY